MDEREDIPMYDFGVLRELRKREGLTLNDVSVRSGISLAVISKLERNQTSAELVTLFRIARVFGMSATDLLALAESPLAHRVSEKAYTSRGFKFRSVKYANLSCFLAEAPAGADVSKPEIHHDDYEICWVLDGRVVLQLPNERHELGKGESLHFDAIQEHTYQALEDSRLLIVHMKKDKRY